MSSPETEACQVDFYLLGETAASPTKLACRLALMAWERKQGVFISTDTQADGEQLDQLMWQYPEGRFLPHALSGDAGENPAPIRIGQPTGLKPVDVVINLCPGAVPDPVRFRRVLEIVPFADEERQASRMKYKTYRKFGITPRIHEISK